MTLDMIVQKIGARILTASDTSKIEIHRVYAGDKMSDILNEVSCDTLLVTNLNTQQLIRVAELMDVPGICLLRDTVPSRDIIDAVEECGTVFLSSPYGMFETCGKLYHCFLNSSREADEHPIFHNNGQ
jgi:hypothetical protein